MKSEDQMLMPWATVHSVMAEMGRKGGQSRSAKKVRSSRQNVKIAMRARMENINARKQR
jgi:transcriptional regulator